jgi:transposase
MTKDDVLFGYRQQLFAEAARTNVSAACRTFGVHRSTYYAWKHQVDRHGLEMLRPRERRRPQMPNALPKMIEERIVSFSIAHPGRGLVHLHAVIRLDKRMPDYRSDEIRPPARRFTSELLEHALRATVDDVKVQIPAELGAGTIRWGDRLDVQQLPTEDDERRRWASYLAKYTTKSTE